MLSYTLTQELKEVADSLRKRADDLEASLTNAEKAWPDYAIVKNFGEWRPRTETPPEGPIWASDGLRVWLIQGIGKPIDAGATAVKFWTAALIPAPPFSKDILDLTAAE